GGAVVLGRIGPFFLCRGSVAPRGPLAPGADVLHDLGLDDAAARAIDHVLTWYGAPFDSVNARMREDQPLSWGVWHFAGDRFAEALTTFFECAPAAAAPRWATWCAHRAGWRWSSIAISPVVRRGRCASPTPSRPAAKSTPSSSAS